MTTKCDPFFAIRSRMLEPSHLEGWRLLELKADFEKIDLKRNIRAFMKFVKLNSRILTNNQSFFIHIISSYHASIHPQYLKYEEFSKLIGEIYIESLLALDEKMIDLASMFSFLRIELSLDRDVSRIIPLFISSIDFCVSTGLEQKHHIITNNIDVIESIYSNELYEFYFNLIDKSMRFVGSR